MICDNIYLLIMLSSIDPLLETEIVNIIYHIVFNLSLPKK
jgi:hypothetical protein